MLERAVAVAGLPDGMLGWMTTRQCGSFGFQPDGSATVDVLERWRELERDLRDHGVDRVASAHQVHGVDVLAHGAEWSGWRRFPEGDGHFTVERGTALAVTVADCTPVFLWHPRGAIAALHAGWRGTAAGILERGLRGMEGRGFPIEECELHLGPAICGRCYEVGPEVLTAMFGVPATQKDLLDVRAVLQVQAERRGVGRVTVSPDCTRCDGERFYSHRGGDVGRQLGIIALCSS